MLTLPEHRGAVIGVAFPRDVAAPHKFDHKNAPHTLLACLNGEELLSSRGQIIVERIWGSYVAIFTTPDLHVRYVLRGPCSLLACFNTRISGVHVFFSVVDDCLPLKGTPFTMHWPVIRAQAARGDYLTRETALAEVTTLEPGERVAHSDDFMTRTFVWNPCRISRTEPISRFEDAVTSLREETLRAVHSWASQYSAITLQLSGGLDSSIVLASLKTAPTAPRIWPVNLYSTECPADERSFARSMASAVGMPLVTIERASDCDLSIFLRCSRTARPVLNYTAPGHVLAIAELSRAYSCEAVFDGELGDVVFGSPYTAEPVTDFIGRHGLHPQVLIVARNLARVRRISIWRAIRDAIDLSRSTDWRSSFLALARIIDASDLDTTCFVTRDVTEEYRREAQRFVHPWLKDGVDAAPTALPLIYALITTTSTSYHAPFRIPGDPPYIRPLISQPLVEVALRIPGALSIRSGWNRSVARTAFANDLSKEVLYRTTKLNFDPWARLTIRRNAAWLTEFLLDGILARERILDKKRVAALLSDDFTEDQALTAHIFPLAYIEGWLRQWAC